MKIGDGVPLQEPKTIRDTSSDGEDSSQSVPVRGSQEQLQAIPEAFSGETAKIPQLLDNLAPDTLEPHRPENMFEELVKIDVFSNVPENVTMDQGLANLVRNPANPTAKEGDRHYLGVTGLDLPNLDPTGLLGGSKPSSNANVPRFVTGGMHSAGSSGGSSTSFVEGKGTRGSSPAGPTTLGGNSIVGGRNMSLYGNEATADGSKRVHPNFTEYFDKAGNRTKTEGETKDGTKWTLLYDSGSRLKETTETTKEGVTTKTVTTFDDNKHTEKKTTTKTDKDGKEIKYDTGEGGNVFFAPTAEEFLRIKNFGGGYTDGRPELQSDTPMERNPAEENPNFGVIDGNPDYIEAKLDKPNLGNIVQPETRPELEGPAPEMPPTPGGNPNSNDPN